MKKQTKTTRNLLLGLMILMPFIVRAQVSALLESKSLNAAVGDTVECALIMDLSKSESLLGSFTGQILWKAEEFEYLGYSRQDSTSVLLVNGGRAGEGRLNIAFVNPFGLSGRQQLAAFRFKVTSAAKERRISAEFTAMAAAKTFVDLTYELDIFDCIFKK
jgi:hypothetical protein